METPLDSIKAKKTLNVKRFYLGKDVVIQVRGLFDKAFNIEYLKGLEFLINGKVEDRRIMNFSQIEDYFSHFIDQIQGE